jgi:hypothetical protein
VRGAAQRNFERYLIGQETEAWEIIYFKFHKSQLPVIEQALRTQSLYVTGFADKPISADSTFLERQVDRPVAASSPLPSVEGGCFGESEISFRNCALQVREKLHPTHDPGSKDSVINMLDSFGLAAELHRQSCSGLCLYLGSASGKQEFGGSTSIQMADRREK